MAIGITPDRLEFVLQKNELASQILLVKNLGESPVKIEISLSEERWNDWVMINPQDMVLAAQAESEIAVLVQGKKDFTAELEILSIPGENAELQIASGIKIPLSVSVPNSVNNYPLLISLFLAFAVVTTLYFWRKRKQI